MRYGKEKNCAKCGKPFTGVTFAYTGSWVCADCLDSDDVIHCRAGDKIIAKHLDYGYDSDSQKAHIYLKENKVYTIKAMYIDGWRTDIELEELPQIQFNSVHFKRYIEENNED